jgi:hypothetical protein
MRPKQVMWPTDNYVLYDPNLRKLRIIKWKSEENFLNILLLIYSLNLEGKNEICDMLELYGW